MKARPILFSTPMVKALLEGRKTQTRRIIKATKDFEEVAPDEIYNFHPGDIELARCPYGEPDDLLWVRESFGYADMNYPETKTRGREIVYKADNTVEGNWELLEGWKPSIHMPRWASRLTLEIIDIRVERIQDISEKDAEAEGCVEGWIGRAIPSTPLGGGSYISSPGTFATAKGKFMMLWESIHGVDSWDENPWIWVIKFKVHKKNIGEFLK